MNKRKRGGQERLSVGAAREWLMRELSAEGPWDLFRFRGALAEASGKLPPDDDYDLFEAKIVIKLFETFQKLLKIEWHLYRSWNRRSMRARSDQRWADFEVGPYKPFIRETHRCLQKAGVLASRKGQARVPTKRLAALFTCQMLSRSLPGTRKPGAGAFRILRKDEYELPKGRTGKTLAELVIDKSRKIYKGSLPPGDPPGGVFAGDRGSSPLI